MNIKTKIWIAVLPLCLVAASCTGGDAGGIYKTANGGIDWQEANKIKDSKNATLATQAISALKFSPHSQSELFASTLGNGIYVTRDAGENWQNVLSGVVIYDFVLDPNDSQKMFAAGSSANMGAVFTTKDGGKSWNQIFNDPIKNSAIRAIDVNPINAQEIVIGSSAGDIMGSSDAGATWKLLQRYTGDRVEKIIWRGDGLVWLLKTAGLFKSYDAGATAGNYTSNVKSVYLGEKSSMFSQSVSSYYQVAISAQNTGVMYLATNAGVIKTNNNGASWTLASLPLRQKTLAPSAVTVSETDDRVVYVGAAGSVYKSVDGGNAWSVSDVSAKNAVKVITLSPTAIQLAYIGMLIK